MIAALTPAMLAERQKTTSTVRHEIGHLITARSQGFATGSITLEKHQAGASVDLTPSIGTISDLVSYSESRIKILYAGSYAESLSNGQVNSRRAVKYMESTASNDFTKVRELLKILAGCACQNGSKTEFQKHLDEINDRLAKDAGRIVTVNSKLMIDMTVLFMKEFDITVQKLGFEPEKFELSEDQIEEFLRGKTIAR